MGQEIQQIIDGLTLPSGVGVTNGGVFAQIAEGFEAIFIAMIVGVVGVYLVMVASLGSLRNPFVIITSLPLAIIGALAALAITGRSLGLPAMMGILMLIGIVVTNAIVLISFVEQLRERGSERVRRADTGRASPAAADTHDGDHDEHRAAAAGGVRRGRGRHTKRGACDRRDRRTGELDGADAGGRAGRVHAGEREHSQPVQADPQTRLDGGSAA